MLFIYVIDNYDVVGVIAVVFGIVTDYVIVVVMHASVILFFCFWWSLLCLRLCCCCRWFR